LGTWPTGVSPGYALAFFFLAGVGVFVCVFVAAFSGVFGVFFFFFFAAAAAAAEAEEEVGVVAVVVLVVKSRFRFRVPAPPVQEVVREARAVARAARVSILLIYTYVHFRFGGLSA
jgi:hypothetical protein